MANKTITELTAVSSVTNADEVEVQKSGETTTKKATILQLNAVEAAARAAQDDVIEAAVGLNTNGSYASLTNAWYIRAAEFAAGITDRSGATGALTESIANALRILDAAIYNTTVFAYTQSLVMRTVTVTCSTADILSCNAVPKVIIPNPGAGYYNELISLVAENDFNSAAFEAGTDVLKFKYNGGVDVCEVPNAFIESGADMVHGGTVTSGVVITPAASIVMYCDSAPTTGDGSFQITCTYRVHAI